jgi:hypothetical protein
MISRSLAACSCHSRIRSAPAAVVIENISSSSISGPLLARHYRGSP